jgi:hypothetical protein
MACRWTQLNPDILRYKEGLRKTAQHTIQAIVQAGFLRLRFMDPSMLDDRETNQDIVISGANQMSDASPETEKLQDLQSELQTDSLPLSKPAEVNEIQPERQQKYDQQVGELNTSESRQDKSTIPD